jgi:hypothetical protein
VTSVSGTVITLNAATTAAGTITTVLTYTLNGGPVFTTIPTSGISGGLLVGAYTSGTSLTPDFVVPVAGLPSTGATYPNFRSTSPFFVVSP